MNPPDPNKELTPENLPTEPVATDEWTMPVQPVDAQIHATEAPGLDAPEPAMEDVKAFPTDISKKPKQFRKKTIGIAFGVCLLIAGGGFTYARSGIPSDDKTVAISDSNTILETTSTDDDTKTSEETPTGTSPEVTPAPATTTPTSPAPVKPATGSTPAPAPPTQPTSKTYGISYTNSCFTPADMTIKRGDSIVFTNNSSRDMWPASDNHPVHTNYSEFDARDNIAPGGSYSFTFTKSGVWGYHDHSKPNCGGTITVQ